MTKYTRAVRDRITKETALEHLLEDRISQQARRLLQFWGQIRDIIFITTDLMGSYLNIRKRFTADRDITACHDCTCNGRRLLSLQVRCVRTRIKAPTSISLHQQQRSIVHGIVHVCIPTRRGTRTRCAMPHE